MRLSVAMLLVFVFGVCGAGVGDAFGRVELNSEAGNVDGDPGGGLDSYSGGSGGSPEILPPEEGSMAPVYDASVIFWFLGLNGDEFGFGLDLAWIFETGIDGIHNEGVQR